MSKILKFTLCLILMFLTACTSHEDEPKFPMIEVDETTLSQHIDGDGEQLSLSFNIDRAWTIEGPKSVNIYPKSGSKGSNTVLITFPSNESTQAGIAHHFFIISTIGVNIKDFYIYQDPASFLECDEELHFDQTGGQKFLSCRSSTEAIISYDAPWLTINCARVSGIFEKTFTYRVEATENAKLEERSTVVELSIGNHKKEILITQKGGILFKQELYDNLGNLVKEDHGEGNYSIPPLRGTYILKVAANTPWSVEKSGRGWSENFSLNQISEDDISGTFTIDVSEKSKDEYFNAADLIFTFKDGVRRNVHFLQRDWRIGISVYRGESLSDEIDKARDKLNEGYFIDVISIDGGNIDTYAPSTVRRVSISNVDNIREGFCERCSGLTSLSLSNVRQIGSRAFSGHNLREISIPATVTYIGDRAFFKRDWYARVTCYNPVPPTIGKDVFDEGVGCGVLRIPMGSKPSYQSIWNWSKYFDFYEEF